MLISQLKQITLAYLFTQRKQRINRNERKVL